ncbi:hypothetical protein D9756_004784 [Leucocoprinus leucothites]|uniref:Methyltransferase domain-containing protein n=1 Tax=Leucocoprinus leucothites TaxID=201217 RepID=A0A8H5LKT8_9AGAR|nr:hypothetical protein D9756_004784 [Leucoagaricus leucothites]
MIGIGKFVAHSMQNHISLSVSTSDQDYRSANAPRLAQLHAILTSSAVRYLLCLHPNELASEDKELPFVWLEWQSWSKHTARGWLDLVHHYTTGTHLSPIPAALSSLLDQIRGVQLPRDPVFLDALPIMKETGMSPKKAHEVSRMAKYVLATINANAWNPADLRIVDIGAGQGYLTRALKLQLPRTRILALDADEAQTIGARRWESRLLPSPSKENPPITHKTIHITPEELFKTIDEWVTERPPVEGHEIPVLLVGLHACGSLTPDIMRTFSRSRSDNRTWKFAASVVVGCCYNLMNAGDFPLSMYMKSLSPPIDLPTSAYHLAAQIPLTWLAGHSPPVPAPSVELALRKVTWRALLGKKIRQLQSADTIPDMNINLNPGRQLPWSRLPAAKTQNFDLNEAGTGATPEMRRLGRLRDTAYNNWGTFIDVAGKKMGVYLGHTSNDLGAERDVGLERLLEVVHTLRCLVGPVVESAIVLDRMVWIEETLRSEGCTDVQAQLVNLFDQAAGSGRNIAIVIAPSIPSIE